MDAMFQDLYGNYRNRKFTDIWGTVDAFLSDYNDGDSDAASATSVNGIPTTISDTSASTLYYLLLARYANSTIAAADENQFKLKVFALIFQYGPTWEKKLEVQKAVRGLIVDGVPVADLLDGGKAIYNSALNPSQPVANGGGSAVGEGTNTIEELTYINQQNTTKYKKSKVDAYSIVLNLLETDVTEEFIGKFRKLFLTVVSPELPLWYKTRIQEDGDDNE